MSLYLAIDGGNSKTDVVIGAADGTVLAYARGPGTCHQNIGLTETMARLDDLVARVRAAAGDDGRVDRAEVYLAGADLPDEVELLSDAIGARGWADELRVDNDTFALLRAGTDAPDAVAVVCGAGINGAGRRSDGATARFPALGMLTGDWGGGGHLGLLALWHAARAEDGRGPATALAAAVTDHYGLSTVADVGARLHRLGPDPDPLTELAPLVFRAAADGDEIARRLVARQADEVVTIATVAARRLGLLDESFAVVLGGGVLRSRSPLLLEPILAGLAAAAPKASTVVVDAPPVLGAALFALDALGADATAHATVRGRLTGPLST
jgi:N-acetylglucosamine kinase-like BadF-type ATPase